MNLLTMTRLLLVLAALSAVPVRAAAQAKAPAKDALAKGFRGLTLALPAAQLAFIVKGDRLDVLVTFEAKTKEEPREKVTATILQNVMVLGVRLAAAPGGTGAIELQVYPNEAQYATLAVQQGSVQLLRRSPGDLELKPMEMASFRKLFK